MKFVYGSAHGSRSLATARQVLLLNCHQFWDKFHWDKCYAQIFCPNGLYWNNESPKPSESPPIVIFQLSSMAEHTLSSTVGSCSWRTSLNIHHSHWCPSFFQLPKPLLNLCMAHCLIPKNLLNLITGFKVFGKMWCRCTAQLSWSSMWHTWHMVLADCQRLSNPSRRQ